MVRERIPATLSASSSLPMDFCGKHPICPSEPQGPEPMAQCGAVCPLLVQHGPGSRRRRILSFSSSFLDSCWSSPSVSASAPAARFWFRVRYPNAGAAAGRVLLCLCCEQPLAKRRKKAPATTSASGLARSLIHSTHPCRLVLLLLIKPLLIKPWINPLYLCPD